MNINEYKETVLQYFYLGEDDITVYRACDGYLGRYKKDDIVTFFGKGETKSNGSRRYPAVHLPKTRTVLKKTHLLCLLRGVEIPEGCVVDHIDGDILNDQRDNIRITTQAINCKNRCRRSDNISGITGIHWSDYHKHFVIRKTIAGKRYSRSRKTLEEAKVALEELLKLDSEYTKRHGK